MLIAICLLGSAVPLPSTAAPPDFADSTFKRVWERTDAPVLSGSARRSWYWGPQAGVTLNEKYTGSKSGTRLVQYFDKARMEINNPAGDRSSEWYVTTGLLAAELVSGKQQVGDKEYLLRQPAEIAVGGDGLSADPDAPTYTSFRPVASLTGPGANRAPRLTGQSVTATINRRGEVGNNQALSLYPGAKLAAYSDVLGHNIPQAIWDFLDLKGVVQQNGVSVGGQALANWVYVMGYPITEPYWTRIKIEGVYFDAMFQMYERRSVAYVPSMPAGWQVQMGNIGSHYYRWIYGGPLPVPLVPVSGPPALPTSVNAIISPSNATIGSQLVASINGFQPGEGITSWFTTPNKEIVDANITFNAGADGTVGDIAVSTIGLTPGLWSLTFYGTTSNHTAVTYFVLSSAASTPVSAATQIQPLLSATARSTSLAASPTRTPVPVRPSPPSGSTTPSATVPVVATEPPGGLVLSVRPGYGPPDGQFTFSARGLANGEQVQVKFTDPNGNIVYPANSNNGRYLADASGRLVITIVPVEAFPAAPLGVWLFELRGESSGQEGVVGFNIR